MAAGGLVVRYDLAERLRDPAVIGWATLGFGIVLYLADRLGMTIRRLEHMTFGAALAIGLAQVLALIPGTSRSGITMTAARFLGFERAEAARFSLLLAIPTIIAAGAAEGREVYLAGDLALGADAVLAAGLSFAFAFLAIAVMMRWLARATFTPFVVYRVVLGLGLLYWVYV